MLPNNDMIHEKCKREGHNNVSLAQLLGVSEATVKHRWRRGNWTIHEVAILNTMVGVPIDWFFDDMDDVASGNGS